MTETTIEIPKTFFDHWIGFLPNPHFKILVYFYCKSFLEQTPKVSIRMTALSKALKISSPTLCTAVKALELLGLIKKFSSPHCKGESNYYEINLEMLERK